MKKAICFGAGGSGKRLFETISKKYRIIGYADNDSKKWGELINDVPVRSINELIESEYDSIVITSLPGKDTIVQQLVELGIDEGIVDDSYVLTPIESRRIFLEKLAYMQRNIPNEIAVAEAGVFEGDFARYINEYYSDKTCYLFDTFSGFDKRDIEKEVGRSSAIVGDYDNTTEELVLGKMKNVDKIRICKGYFPESAQNIEERFCFVNLDLDLYEPTYNGLYFFAPKMVKGGVILVHDYFSENFQGPRDAVDKFMKESDRNYFCEPIGDGISIMIVGF